MSETLQCPVCRNRKDNLELEKRSSVPTLQNITLPNVLDARNYPTGKLSMQRCGSCGFVWNSAFDNSIILYDETYNNDVSMSAYYRKHLEDMADRVLASIPADECLHYVEVGCGEGDFINLIIERAGSRCASATGFDPSFSNETGLNQKANVHKCFFTLEQVAKIDPKTNVICSRHTIEHVSDVQDFARSLSAAISHPNIKLFVETPDVNWILKNSAFQDFFYEHCSIYTPESISALFYAQGLRSKTDLVYGDQYMWSEVWQATELSNVQHQLSGSLEELAINYVAQTRKLQEYWSDYLRDRKKYGGVAIWGAASKGVTFSLLLEENSSETEICQLDYAIDLNPAKQNRFLPVTSLPVVDPETALKENVQTVIIMNPNYEAEIRELISGLPWNPEIQVLNG